MAGTAGEAAKAFKRLRPTIKEPRRGGACRGKGGKKKICRWVRRTLELEPSASEARYGKRAVAGARGKTGKGHKGKGKDFLKRRAESQLKEHGGFRDKAAGPKDSQFGKTAIKNRKKRQNLALEKRSQYREKGGIALRGKLRKRRKRAKT